MGDARTMGQSERLMLQVAELESHSCLSPLMMPLAADAGPGLQGWVSVCPTGFGLAFLVVPPSPPLTVCHSYSTALAHLASERKSDAIILP